MVRCRLSVDLGDVNTIYAEGEGSAGRMGGAVASSPDRRP
jgi:hypothetical protein